MVDMQEYAQGGYIDKAPHFNSILNVLENPEVTPILKALIEESARPLRAIEDFARRLVRLLDLHLRTVVRPKIRQANVPVAVGEGSHNDRDHDQRRDERRGDEPPLCR
jgi:hypothetical protein